MNNSKRRLIKSSLVLVIMSVSEALSVSRHVPSPGALPNHDSCCKGNGCLERLRNSAWYTGVLYCITATLISCTVMSTCNHTCEENGCLGRLSHTAYCMMYMTRHIDETLKPCTSIFFSNFVWRSLNRDQTFSNTTKSLPSFACILLSEIFFVAENSLGVTGIVSCTAKFLRGTRLAQGNGSCGEHGCPERHCHAIILAGKWLLWESQKYSRIQFCQAILLKRSNLMLFSSILSEGRRTWTVVKLWLTLIGLPFFFAYEKYFWKKNILVFFLEYFRTCTSLVITGIVSCILPSTGSCGSLAAINVSSFSFQAMILTREIAALSFSVIPLCVSLQRFCGQTLINTQWSLLFLLT